MTFHGSPEGDPALRCWRFAADMPDAAAGAAAAMVYGGSNAPLIFATSHPDGFHQAPNGADIGGDPAPDAFDQEYDSWLSVDSPSSSA